MLFSATLIIVTVFFKIQLGLRFPDKSCESQSALLVDLKSSVQVNPDPDPAC